MDTRLFAAVILVFAFIALAHANTESSSESSSSPPDVPVSQESWDTSRLIECIEDLFGTEIRIGGVYNTVVRMIDAEAYGRLEEARSHYEDSEQFVGAIKPEPLKSCEKIRNELDVSALIPATKKCFSQAGKDIMDREAVEILVEESFFFQILLEIYFGCEYGDKTGQFLRDAELFEVILSKSLLKYLQQVKDDREKCLEALKEAYSLAYDEGKEFVDDAVRARIREAREFYDKPNVSREQAKPSPLDNCKQIEEKTDKAMEANNECFWDGGVMGWHRQANLYYLSKRLDDRGLDIMEAETACEWGAKSAEMFEWFTVLDAMAEPKRVSSW